MDNRHNYRKAWLGIVAWLGLQSIEDLQHSKRLILKEIK